ncbi:hypothetical protein [uncultured Devosia sp.]|uniref:hypothetical protein n=1 Tax=uncultured Devosia sp. TaxID=211434 RepID=UPI00261CE688|nr:hypothetical protein [uncultured Devosia sp.]
MTTTQPRHDMYSAIHKGIRYAHCQQLMHLSNFDIDDDVARDALIASMRRHMVLCHGHLHHENEHIHTALEARSPGASEVAEEGHVEHEQSFAEIENLIEALAKAPKSERAAAARALYRRFALFMAHDFEHMNEEETILQTALQYAFTDAELMEIEHRIVTSIPAEEVPLSVVPMLCAMHPSDRRATLSGMKQGMPPEAFGGVMEGMVRPHVSDREWAQLSDLRG